LKPARGSANGVVRLWERAKAERFAVAMTPFVEAERLAREGREVFLSARIKTGSNHKKRTRLWRAMSLNES